jgi:diguanylate cyclase (GGDEF)-like protein
MDRENFLVELGEIVIEILRQIRQSGKTLSKEIFKEFLNKNKRFDDLLKNLECSSCIDEFVGNMNQILTRLNGIIPNNLILYYDEILKTGSVLQKKQIIFELITTVVERLEKSLGSFDRIKSVISDIMTGINKTVSLLSDSEDENYKMLESDIESDKKLIDEINSTTQLILDEDSLEGVLTKLADKLKLISDSIKNKAEKKENFLIDIKNKKSEIQNMSSSFAINKDSLEKIKSELENYKAQVIRDFLTGLYNRQYFDEIIERSIEEFDRYGKKFSLLFIDIDDFKAVNDNYGHVVGDFVLKYVADVIKRSIRKVDLAFRYGGEEFVVVMPNTNLESAAKVADRILNDLRKTVFKYKNIDIKLTASIGLQEMKKGCNASQLVEEADKRMLKAKFSGKNRVVSEL